MRGEKRGNATKSNFGGESTISLKVSIGCWKASYAIFSNPPKKKTKKRKTTKKEREKGLGTVREINSTKRKKRWKALQIGGGASDPSGASSLVLRQRKEGIALTGKPFSQRFEREGKRTGGHRSKKSRRVSGFKNPPFNVCDSYMIENVF